MIGWVLGWELDVWEKSGLSSSVLIGWEFWCLDGK